MTYSINKITDIFQLNPIIIQVNAILEDFVQLAPASPWSDYPAPAEYGPGHASALFAGTMDALPSDSIELEVFIEKLDLDWSPE